MHITDTSWIINGLSDKYKYVFRVSALNSYGWSDPSTESTEFDLNEAARKAEKEYPIILITLGISIPTSVCFIVVICILCGKDFSRF